MFAHFSFLLSSLAISLVLSTVAAFTFIPGTPSECDNLTISWTGECLQVLRNLACLIFEQEGLHLFSFFWPPYAFRLFSTDNHYLHETVGFWNTTKYSNINLSVQQWIGVLFYATPDAGNFTILVNNVGRDRLQFRWNNSSTDCRGICRREIL